MSDESLVKWRRYVSSCYAFTSLWLMGNRHIVSIHVLYDDSLLNIFYLFYLLFLGEVRDDPSRLYGGGPWVQGRWWHRLAQVCQRWWNLVLGSASFLCLSLICTHGTPVENMLAHSPHLPLTVDYSSEDGITAEDEEGILLALKQRHHIRHLRLHFPVHILQKLVMAIDEEFPILEYLIVWTRAKDSTVLKLPKALQAPNLCHLMLRGFICPIPPCTHLTAPGLVTLYLIQWVKKLSQCLAVLQRLK